MEVMPEDSAPDCCDKDGPSYTGCCVADSFSDGYRVRNLWIDVCMRAMQKGWASKTASDAADECVDRYKAKFDVK